jgi:ribonuclease HI
MFFGEFRRVSQSIENFKAARKMMKIALAFPQQAAQEASIIFLRTNPLTKMGRSFMVKAAADMANLVAYIDGGSLGNPGPAGVGVILDGAASGPIRIAKWIGRQDNNVAEYVALMEALQCALSLRARKLHVFSDSQVVVRQMTGVYKCRSSLLYSLHWTCRKLARSLEFSISHVDREQNGEANQLAFRAVRNRQA